MAETLTGGPVSQPEEVQVTPGVRALIEAARVSEAMSARFAEQATPGVRALIEAARVSEAMSARFAEQVTPALKTLARAHRLTLKQVDSGVWEQLATSANLFASVGIASVLREDASGLIEHPTAWLDEVEEAARAGDERAGDALLLVRYLFGCFLLLAQRLNPSARAIERVGALVALSVLMTVVVGTTYANSPKTLEKWDTLLGTPLGILGVYLAISGSGGNRPRRQKPSLNRRGSSKPRRRLLARYRHR
ncbi:hypothetical protein F6X68_21550 [Micromonospora sp. AMSO12t]|uniref:hypothetical protein n=1 Tax=Micromonospora sp. AMSO12t TaxID=2650410 RepID=UPI00124B933F|nr:hypothetical protein [Micromonospora sp. AMSO12t]KAB1141593.1 hypothetical protein F6X68_21550 [Micromonospora sp. AMSO12t]